MFEDLVGKIKQERAAEAQAAIRLELAEMILSGVPLDVVFGKLALICNQDVSTLDKPIGSIYLTSGAYSGLAKIGIATVGDLLKRSPQDLLDIRGFGHSHLAEVREGLKKLGLTLKDDTG